MTNKQFYQKINNTTRDYMNQLADLDEQLTALEDKQKDTRKYSADYIAKTIAPELAATRSRSADVSAAAQKAIEKITADYVAELSAADTLKGEELTPDAQLLGLGVALTEKDLRAILDRNTDNRTMTMLALRYAKDHGIELGMQYIGNSQNIQEAQQIPGITSYIFKHFERGRGHGTAAAETQYSQTMGEGTALYNFYME